MVARLGIALLGIVLLVNCAEPPPPAAEAVTELAEIPASVLLAEQAPPFYSLQQSADGRHWIAVFGDAVDLTLRLARGSLEAHQAHVDELLTIDRIDITPGINPYFGRHAYLQHAGLEHLFYTDQELADARVTKWIYRPVGSADPWTVDLLPEPMLPVAVLPVPAAGSEHPGFTLFGIRGDAEEEPVLAYQVRPRLLADDDSAAIFGGTRTELVDTASDATSAPGPALSAYHCAGRHGLSMAADAGQPVLYEIVEEGRNVHRINLPKRASALPERTPSPPLPLSVGCSSMELLTVAYVRDGAAHGAHEIIAAAIDHEGEVSAEQKVTIGHEVRVLAVFPDPAAARNGDGTEGVEEQGKVSGPALTVLFSELALDEAGEPEHRLSLVAPDAEGTYRKSTLALGSGPVQDARVLRTGGKLVVTFRRANELRLLLAALPAPAAAAASQSGGSW